MGEIRNAKITDTMLGREDHGIMTFFEKADRRYKKFPADEDLEE